MMWLSGKSLSLRDLNGNSVNSFQLQHVKIIDAESDVERVHLLLYKMFARCVLANQKFSNFFSITATSQKL